MRQRKEMTNEQLAKQYKNVVNSVKAVFKAGDIDKLTEGAYRFIITYMSFIAHYSCQGFKDVYHDIDKFALKLQTSEYSHDTNYTLKNANHWETKWFVEKHGAERQRLIANTIREIVKIAKAHDTPLFV
jgi:hypothetical protein